MMPFLLALSLLAASGAPNAERPRAVVAVNAEKASGFASLAECEQALGPRTKTARSGRSGRGNLLNRAQGNRSKCLVVDGEPLIVVFPRGG